MADAIFGRWPLESAAILPLVTSNPPPVFCVEYILLVDFPDLLLLATDFISCGYKSLQPREVWGLLLDLDWTTTNCVVR